MMKTMIIIMPMLLIFMNHPLSMGLILLIQTILISLIIGSMNLNFWYSYVLMLIMVGGMLILFIYMTSIASNEKFKFNHKLFYFTITLMIMINLFFILMDYLNESIYNYTINHLFMNENKNFYLAMSKFYNFPLNMLFILIFIHLLICLIAVVKIAKTNQGPLRQLF